MQNLPRTPFPSRTRVTALLTTPRSVTGFLDHQGERLSDAVNRPLESVLRLNDAYLGRLANMAANERVALAVIPKNHIALVFAHDEAPQFRDRRVRAYIPKQQTKLLVLIAGLRVSGHAHAASQLDPIQLHRLVLGTENKFIALTDARLALDIEGMSERDIGLALLNVRHIEFLSPVMSPTSGTSERVEVTARS